MDEAVLQMRIGTAIRERRIAMKMSQEAFADSIQMHRAYYSKIERGERNITLATLWRVCVGLRLDASKLLDKAGL